MPARLAAYRLPILAALAIAGCLYGFSPNFRYASGPAAGPYAGDFLQEWLGGWIVQSGDWNRFYDVPYAYGLQHDERLVGFAWNADEYLPIVYPPFYYLVISPLSLVPLHWAAWIWAGLMLAALGAALWLLYDGLPRPSNVTRPNKLDGLGRPSYWPWLIPAAVLFVPVLESLSSSQKGTLCLLILTGTFTLWNRRRPLTAGMAFGLLAFKPQLVLVIAIAALWKRQWRFVAGGAITGGALAGLSLAMGADVCEQYVRFALGAGQYMRTSGYDLYKSHSVWGFAALLFGSDGGITAKAFGLALAGLVVWQLSKVLRGRLAPGSDRFAVQFAALVVATVLLAPHLFTYDLTILLLPMAMVVGHYTNPKRERGMTAGSSSLALRVSVWLTALLYVAPAISTGVAAATGLQLTVPLMMLYVAALSSTVQQSRRQGAIRRFDFRGPLPAANNTR